MDDQEPQLILQEELISFAQHLVQSRKEFTDQLGAVTDALLGISTYLEAFSRNADTRDELLASRMTLHTSVLDMLGTLKDVVAENTVALNENTTRLDEFLKKCDTYFGSGSGMEFEN